MNQPQQPFLSNLTFQEVSGTKIKSSGKDYQRKIYDNIHGFIYFDQDIWDFIDTLHFQRLRKIKQLGCLEYVFPGATHTRFQHCIGTAFLAKRFIQLLIANNQQEYKFEDKKSAILTVTLAGLIHDIGHGPYSHTFDSSIVTEIEVDGKKINWTHQLASEILFDHMTQLEHLKDALTPTEVDRVKALIRGTPTQIRKWEFELISNKINGIDVDKLDYFRRDAFYLGAKNIYIDHQLLMNEARIVNRQICYPTKYVEIVYNIFHSRYKLYKNYYYNVINTGVEQMVCDILVLTKEKFQIKKACEEIYTNPYKYMRLNDCILEKVEDVYEDMLQRGDPEDQKHIENFRKAVQLIQRMRTRKLYKFVKELTYYVKEKEHIKVVDIFEKHFKKSEILGEIVKTAKISPSDICITINDVGFGLKEANPLRKVGFFRKEEEYVSNSRRKLQEQEIESLSMLYTNAYIERSIKFFIKDDSLKMFLEVDKAIEKFRKDYRTILQLDSGLGGKTPGKIVPENQSQANGGVQALIPLH